MRFSEKNTMYSMSKLVFVAALMAASTAFAQAGDNAKIVVQEPWARATPSGAMSGAAYMTIDNKSTAADRLTGVASEVAAKVQVHEMKVVNGVMQMRELADGLAIPAGKSVTLKPGSYHVMLMGLKKPLVAGQSFPLTLTFAKAGTISVTVPIKAMGAPKTDSGMKGMQHDMPGMGKMEMK